MDIKLSQILKIDFLTYKIEEIFEKRGVKIEKNHIFYFFYKRKVLIFSFEIPPLVEQSLEGFRTVFVLKIGQQTKKSTPKWRKGCLKNGWVVNTMDKERVFIDGMGQDMRYTSKKLEYISLYINLFYILLEIPDFCLEYFFWFEPFI